jgi:hypothetical protein
MSIEVVDWDCVPAGMKMVGWGLPCLFFLGLRNVAGNKGVEVSWGFGDGASAFGMTSRGKL